MSLTKNERRIATVLARLPLAREQLLVALDEFGPKFDLDAFVAAAEHDDPIERNKVAVVERELDLIVHVERPLRLADQAEVGIVHHDVDIGNVVLRPAPYAIVV